MEGKCSKCYNIAELAPANLSHITGERLHRTWCKSCEKERKDKWRAANIDRHNTRSRNWAVANPETKANTNKKYREANKVKVRKTEREWKENNKHKVRAYCSSRRKRVKQATPIWADLKDITKVYIKAQELGLVVDHVIPLRGKIVCGLHTSENLQLLTFNQNAAKAASLII